MYNVKEYIYPNSTEIRIYQKPISEESESEETEKRQVNKWEIIKEDGVYISVNQDGEIRNNKDTWHCISASRTRSKQKIMEYSRANKWEWFFTFTFNPEIVDNFNYQECYTKLSKWLNNVRTRKCPNIKYLAVPEQHKSGRWHFHALISNIDMESLQMVVAESKQKDIYNINAYKLGFSTATPVKDTKRVSTYISKYITKELMVNTSGRQRYLASKNLSTAEVHTRYIDPEEIEDLTATLLTTATYSKQVLINGVNRITYINQDT